jgi:hypothetical protein
MEPPSKFCKQILEEGGGRGGGRGGNACSSPQTSWVLLLFGGAASSPLPLKLEDVHAAYGRVPRGTFM